MDASFFDFPIYHVPEANSESVGEGHPQMVIITNPDVNDPKCVELLDGIRNAIGSNNENTVMVTLSEGEKIKISDQLFFSSMQYCIILGISAKEVGLNLEKSQFRIHQINDTRYVFSPALKVLTENTDAKKALWQALKTGFMLK